MRTAGVMGWPVAHSKSPLIHRFWLDALGLDGDYSRLAVRPEALEAAIAALPALGFTGVNVTLPHKVAVMAHLSDLDPVARLVGAVNTVVVQADGSLFGTNTDVAGFLEPLGGLAPKRALVVGAGGAARAVLLGLKQLGVAEVRLMNRTRARAQSMLAEAGLRGEVLGLEADVPPVDLVVNASTLGMLGEPALELDLSALPASATVYDIVYSPLETGLLKSARALGLETVDGLAMLIGQAAVAFELFYGAAAPRDRDPALRALLVGGVR